MKGKAFAVSYYMIIFIAYIFMLPILGFFSILKPKYTQSIPARFFLRHNRHFSSIDFVPEIWIHACSLGEVNSLKAILDENILKKNLILTTTTNTGFTKANELFSSYKNVLIRYLPFEIFIPFVMPKNLKKLVVLEAELWFMLFFCAKKNGAKNILLNARISTKSYPKYKKNAWFYRNLFCYIDKIFCQQDADKERLSELGAQNIESIGNIKALIKPNTSENFAIFEKYKDTLLMHGTILIVAGSTHKGEEELILRSFKANFNDSPRHRLIIAPRHPERFDEVWGLIESHGFSATKYSQNGLNYESNIILLDTLGELINAYAISDCVILGGSFVKVGGHNPLECAYFGVKLISGEHIFNQFALFALVEGYKIAKNDELSDILGDLESLAKSKIIDSALLQMQNKISEILSN